MTGGKADPQVVRRHLFALQDALGRLRKHSGHSVETLRVDVDLRWIVERGLQLCAQNALDIATHIAAGSGLDAPDYASAIDRLAELSVLPPDFARRLRAIAGFRNVLVHAYLQVDPQVVDAVLKHGLDDLDTFVQHIERWLSAD